MMPHDCERNGTTTLFAARNTANGKVISLCQQRHRHQEWIHCLRLIYDAMLVDRESHIIAGNHAAHKPEKVRRSLSATRASTSTQAYQFVLAQHG